jgi:MFS superfamily sulfate permease-like transporter
VTAAILTPGVSRPTLASAPRDFAASVVVFLVAMPLCMGIAIASGVPPEKGLITGIIGGIVVGALAGSPLQVSGPAAGLAVIVFEMVRDLGLSALGPILILAGAIQLIAGAMKLGGWFRAISPAVVHGMLAGIGVLIVVGQFHVLFDQKPLPSGLANLFAMPGRLVGLSPDSSLGATELAFGIGLTTIAGMLLWDKFKPQPLKLLPGALTGVLLGTLVAFAFGLPVARVDVPENIVSAIAPPADLLGSWANPAILVAAVAIAFIASAETLLSAAAVDKMHNGVRTDYNKELRAQGVGNLLCGAAGALPMTGVIVRSSANVQAGAATRLSTILHGTWILGFVALLPWILREIPMASLAAVLVVTGWRLVHVGHVRNLLQSYGVLPALIWGATLVTVVAVDLLTGVLVGIALSMLEVVPYLRRLKLRVEQAHDGEAHAIRLRGVASFLTLPKLSAVLEDSPPSKPVEIDVSELEAIDHTSAEMVRDWLRRRKGAGAPVSIKGADPRLPALTA